MKKEQAKQLIEKYYEGQTSLEEEQRLQAFFQNEQIPEELQSHADYFRYTTVMRRENTDSGFDPLGKVEAEPDVPITPLDKSTESESGLGSRAVVWSLRIAAGFILLLIGFSAGQFLNNNGGASTEQVAALQQEVQQMKEALMYGGNYQQASAGERLSAVKNSTRFVSDNNELDRQITDILIYTMNNDNSVNVRMAAAEALFRFRDESPIQKALVKALPHQEDPQMQLTLIDMLVQLKAKGALNEMNKLLMDSDTREIVRKRLQAGIAELKT
ncbi:HEAT repeat domain-containing protein [Fodinibius halophilus]|uniref:HEAT repeat domain-containing protein n=1 Tax=Fodinibius halophilus TaxID=1736908 RepID=A0A6M1T514_9BACT|nr:HEAT repeat domain-containing protein [Fodinibius halophilus]NGP87041.1 HEAT repeat domain-containing protein [Fodinibius halophilus]